MVCIIIVGHMPILPYFVTLLLIGLLSPSPFYFPLFSGVAVSRTRIAMKFRILACLCVTWICPGDILVHFRQCASWTLFPGDGRRLLLTSVRPYTSLPQHTGENAVVAATPTMEDLLDSSVGLGDSIPDRMGSRSTWTQEKRMCHIH